ncbi:TIR domain-containing protein [Rhizobium ruizarguesonis]|nr:TIR domain-containing protein [Rhizobium ruizarguesonis]
MRAHSGIMSNGECITQSEEDPIYVPSDSYGSESGLRVPPLPRIGRLTLFGSFSPMCPRVLLSSREKAERGGGSSSNCSPNRKRRQRLEEVACTKPELTLPPTTSETIRKVQTVARLFISHSSWNNDKAVEVRDWLAKNGWDDVFLDLDPERGIAAGQRWKEALQRAAWRCEVVLALISKEWLASSWCKSEVDAARLMGKKVIALLVEIEKSQVPPDLTDEQYVDLTGDPQAYRRLKEGLKRAGLDQTTFPFPPGRRPYPGFAYLEEDDAAVFFGRDAQVVRGLDEIRRIARVGVTRMLVILGASGSGKSSFLRAGLWPRLKRDDLAWLPLQIVRPERAAMSGTYGLTAALYEVVSNPRFTNGMRRRSLPCSRADIQNFIENADNGLAVLLAALRDIAQVGFSGVDATPPTILLGIDQGEELFNDEGREDATKFIDILTKTLAADSRVLAILVMRSDALPLVQGDPGLAALPKDTFTLDMMLEGSFRAVIEGPARLIDPPLTVDPQLVDALLQDVSGQDALPLLAFTLAHLYDNTRVDNALTLPGYDKIGRLTGVIAKTVAQAFTEAAARGEVPKDPREQLRLTRSAFVPHLAQVNSTGQFVRRVALHEKIPDDARPLIDRFAEQRLLIRDRRQDVEVIEVAHEALLRQPPFSDWLAEDREFLLWHDRLTQARAAFEADERGLLAGRELAIARSYMQTRAERDFELAELAFIRDSIAADDKRRAEEAEQQRQKLAAEKEEQERRIRDAERIAEEQTKAAAAQKRATRTVLVGLVVAVLGLAGWMNQDYLEGQVRWVWTIRPYIRDQVRPYVKTAEQERALKPLQSFKECAKDAHCPDMVVLPAGEFIMGSPPDEPGGTSYAAPQHRVLFAKPFAVSKFAVTFEEWDACAAYGDCDPRISDGGWGRGRRPVINITLVEAQNYVAWLSRVTERTYRLLSEAEWEYAARAVSTTAYSFGDDPAELGEYGWFNGNSGGKTHPVGEKKPNAFGLYDMHGNVFSLVADCAHNNYSSAPEDGSAWGGEHNGNCTQGINRGGAWSNDPEGLRSAQRYFFTAGGRNSNLGFRVARTLTP